MILCLEFFFYKGGTVDIAVHQKMEGQKLKELCRASGGDCGGTSVDTEFLNVMKKVFGEEIATEFQTNDPESFLDLLRSFELIKRTIKTNSTGTIKVNIPNVALSKFCELKYNKTLDQQVDSSELKQVFLLSMVISTLKPNFYVVCLHKHYQI